MFGSGLLSPTHLVLILIVVLIIFGPGKLPDVGKAVGKSIREFKNASNSGEEEQKVEATKEKEADIKKAVEAKEKDK